MAELLLDVHGEHLAAEREALSLLDDLLVRRHSIVAHHHMTLQRQTALFKLITRCTRYKSVQLRTLTWNKAGFKQFPV